MHPVRFFRFSQSLALSTARLSRNNSTAATSSSKQVSVRRRNVFLLKFHSISNFIPVYLGAGTVKSCGNRHTGPGERQRHVSRRSRRHRQSNYRKSYGESEKTLTHGFFNAVFSSERLQPLPEHGVSTVFVELPNSKIEASPPYHAVNWLIDWLIRMCLWFF